MANLGRVLDHYNLTINKQISLHKAWATTPPDKRFTPCRRRKPLTAQWPTLLFIKGAPIYTNIVYNECGWRFASLFGCSHTSITINGNPHQFLIRGRQD